MNMIFITYKTTDTVVISSVFSSTWIINEFLNDTYVCKPQQKYAGNCYHEIDQLRIACFRRFYNILKTCLAFSCDWIRSDISCHSDYEDWILDFKSAQFGSKCEDLET